MVFRKKLNKNPIYDVWIYTDEWFNIHKHPIDAKLKEIHYLSYIENGDICGVSGGCIYVNDLLIFPFFSFWKSI